MRVTRITTQLQLPASSLIDVLLVQWHTPTPAMGGVMDRTHCERRRQALQRITRWLQTGYECAEEDRPLFILFPEISIPRALVGHVDALLEATKQPTVAIGGLEYMTRTAFEELGATLNLVVPLDEVVEQLEGGDILNAAGVWLREPDGAIRHFLQPKNHPFEPEAPQLCRGKLLGLFTSADQGKGRRLNFTAHVCADFAAANRVRQMLIACEQEMTNTHLDVAFVIQHQVDQAAEQFLDAAAAYFAPPTGGDTWADTAGASIVMINNAAERTRRRRGEWGDSQFKYQFMYGAKRKRLGGTDTYFLLDDGAHDTQAGVMRAAGPSAYLVHYKPRSLVRQVRGQERPEPFRDGPCLHAPLDEGELQFAPLRAAPFWLKCEWIEVAESFQDELAKLSKEDRVPTGMVDWWVQQLDDAMDLWLMELYATPSAGIVLVENCLLLQRDIDDCPPNEREPEEWGQVVRSAMREFLRVFVLSVAWESNGKRISPAPQGLRHAVSPTGEWVSFVWGHGARTVEVVRSYRDAMERDPGIVATFQDIIVVMMGPTRDQPSQAQIDEAFDTWSPIHRQGLPDGSLDRVGEVAAPTVPSPKFIHSQPLERALMADSPEAASDLASHLGAIN